MIRLVCASCRQANLVPDQLAGQEMKCPGCGQVLQVFDPPAPGGEDEEPAPAASASQARGPLGTATEAPLRQGSAMSAEPVAADGSPSSLTDFLAPPQAADELGWLGGFRILHILGQGGMGVVFAGEDPRLGRKVAIKAMLPHLAGNPASRGRFLREARAAAALQHDHIVPIYHVGEEGGAPFIVMPLLKGESLDHRLQGPGRLAPAEVARIGREIALALGAAHAAGLIHRDVKPANVWLEAPGDRVKVLDFGLARASADGSRLTLEGVILGTPAYMAPEQANGLAVDGRCDLWSLGVVLYQMCTGQLPFRGIDALSTLMAVATENPPPPAQLNPEVPAALSDLVMSLLQKDRSNRPATAEAVAARLQTMEQVSGAPPTKSLAGPRVGRGRWVAQGTLTVVVIGALVAVAAWVGRRNEEELSTGGENQEEVRKISNRKGGEEVEVPITPRIKMKFCWVPAGEAQLGSPLSERLRVKKQLEEEVKHPDWLALLDDEAEEVRGKFKTNGFWLGKYPVTQEEWEAVMGQNPSYFQPGQRQILLDGIRATRHFPRDGATWNGCQGFLEKMNASVKAPPEMGRGTFVLPHEDEWEYACRGGLGNQRAYYFGDQLNGDKANCDGNHPFGTEVKGPNKGRTTQVGSYDKKGLVPPHPWGLCDMHGNVWQWCANLQINKDGTQGRAMRGGYWNAPALRCRSANRQPRPANWRNNGTGLRVCYKSG